MTEQEQRDKEEMVGTELVLTEDQEQQDKEAMQKRQEQRDKEDQEWRDKRAQEEERFAHILAELSPITKALAKIAADEAGYSQDTRRVAASAYWQIMEEEEAMTAADEGSTRTR